MINTFRKFAKGINSFTKAFFKENQKANPGESFPKVGFLSLELQKELESVLGFEIIKPEIYEQALTHRSYLQVIPGKFHSNERLEFLGDSVLGMVIADYLFSLHSNVLEGELTKMRSWLVNKNSLAVCAQQLQLDKFLMLSFSAAKSLESGSKSILSDAMEAIIGAIYLERGFESARVFITEKLIPLLMNKSIMVDTNYKSILLETVQSFGKPSPKYVVMDEKGPDHLKEFVVGVYVENELTGIGTGKSKKEAEQVAAKNALEQKNFDSSLNQENMLNL